MHVHPDMSQLDLLFRYVHKLRTVHIVPFVAYNIIIAKNSCFYTVYIIIILPNRISVKFT